MTDAYSPVSDTTGIYTDDISQFQMCGNCCCGNVTPFRVSPGDNVSPIIYSGKQRSFDGATYSTCVSTAKAPMSKANPCIINSTIKVSGTTKWRRVINTTN